MHRLRRCSIRTSNAWPIRDIGALLCVALVLAIVCLAFSVREGAAQPAPGISTCTARAWGAPLSQWVARGETVRVRTMVGWSCPERTRPYDLAIVVDAPALAGEESAMPRDDLMTLVRRVDLETNDQARIGIVAFGSDAKPLTGLEATTARHLEVVRAMAGPDDGVPTGSGGLAAGVREGLKTLAIGKRPPPGGETQDPAQQAMVVLAAPRGEAYCAGFGTQLQHATEDDVDVTVVCMNAECQPSCLDNYDVRILSRYAWDIMALEQQGQAWQSRLRVEMLDVHEFPQGSLAVVEASIDPRYGSYSDESHRIRWRLDVRHDFDGRLLMEYDVRPEEVGRFPVRVAGHGTVRDTWGRSAAFDLPRFDIVVTEGRVFRSYLPWLGQSVPAPTPTPPDKTFRR